MVKKPSKGVVFFGIVMIAGALFHMWAVYSAGYKHYCLLHQEYASGMLYFRYMVSWGIKIAGLGLGVGILKLKEWARKLLIVYYVFIIATVHLKHAYPAYSIHMKMLDENFGHLLTGFTFASLTWPALIIQRGVDIVFGLAVIYFFTRPEVRRQFQG